MSMKLSPNPWQHRGLCHVCGKPTRLLIHKQCGEAMHSAKAERKRLYEGKRAQAKYGRGKMWVPE